MGVMWTREKHLLLAWLLPFAANGRPSPGVMRTGKLSLLFTCCSIWESRLCNLHGQHNRLDPGGSSAGLLPPSPNCGGISPTSCILRGGIDEEKILPLFSLTACPSAVIRARKLSLPLTCFKKAPSTSHLGNIVDLTLMVREQVKLSLGRELRRTCPGTCLFWSSAM